MNFFEVLYMKVFDIGDGWLCCAGLVLCLMWNVIAVSTAWIQGEGEFMNMFHIFPGYLGVLVMGLIP